MKKRIIGVTVGTTLNPQRLGEHVHDGKSAYELAVEAGFKGTQEEWLYSLKGKDGVDGKDGYSPVKGKDYFDGQPGRDGRDGKDGKDGYTPVKGVDYFDGTDGKDGKDGKNGYTPVKGVDYFDGRNGRDGRDGEDGEDAVSPVVDIADIDGGHRITITDKDGSKTFDVMDGKDGQDGQGGSSSSDIFEIDMLTVNAHGGVAANEDLNGLTTHEILKKILYPYVQPVLGNATASPNGGTYEKGVTKTITQVSISVTKKSEAITKVALYNGSTLISEKTGDDVKNGGTITFTGLSIVVPTNGNQLTVNVTDAKGTTQEKKTTAMTFVYPYYIGTCAAGATINEALVEGLSKKVVTKGNKSNSFTVSNGHMVFAYPKAHGVLKSILDPNNFETIGNYTRSEVNVTGLDGTAQTYYVYVSGATTVSAFTVNFKY